MSITRAELIERLKKLAESEPPNPDELDGGWSVCYIPARVKYCPVCRHWWTGSKLDANKINEIVDQYNDFIMRLQQLGLDVTLTVAEFCSECGNVVAGKTFLLEIKYPDQSDPVRFELDNIEDLQLIERFLQGQDRYVDKYDEEHPLKNKIGRIADLFGVKKNDRPFSVVEDDLSAFEVEEDE